MIVERGQRGFTLVEMLVALTIFALLAAAGVSLLHASVNTQAAVEERLADLTDAARLRTLLANDLAQAVDRPRRAPGGGVQPAFVGLRTELRMTRAGWQGASVTEPDLQAVRWSLAGGKLIRTAARALDGGEDKEAAVLARDVEAADFQYRGAAGGWRSDWAPGPSEPALPAAVELTIHRSGEAPVRMVLALPLGAIRRPDPAAPGADAERPAA